ncbi:MBL fold metallo-hydrolase [Pontibacter chitinilyticus]|uniref:MBL fold metallo-hydrolase n=1 Tax=Pontibacter chitinilyticus TaxID=2674989 RepID=UPI00321986AD
MKTTFTLLLSMLVSQVFAQQPTPDQIQTKEGMLTVQPIQHASLVLSWNDKTIYVDPVGGAEPYAGLKAPDMILITDIHQDHLDPQTLDALDTKGATLVVPQAVADKLPAKYKSQAVILANGKSTTQLGIPIKAEPMYNLPESADAMHTKGRGNGYILEMGGKRVYIAGDTEGTPEMRALKNIDVAFIPMNLPYTMDIDQAASAVLDFKPKVVYPYHYRGKDGLSDVESFKKLVNAKNKSIDVRLLTWYAKQ